MLTRKVLKDILEKELSVLRLGGSRTMIDAIINSAIDAIMTANTSQGVFLPDAPGDTCENCGETISNPVAHNTGDGWDVSWCCPCEQGVVSMNWPFGDGWVSPAELRQAGFDVV